MVFLVLAYVSVMTFGFWLMRWRWSCTHCALAVADVCASFIYEIRGLLYRISIITYFYWRNCCCSVYYELRSADAERSRNLSLVFYTTHSKSTHVYKHQNTWRCHVSVERIDTGPGPYSHSVHNSRLTQHAVNNSSKLPPSFRCIASDVTVDSSPGR